VDRDWSIVWLVSLIVAPLGWVYYYWLAAGPLLARMKVRSWPVLAAGVALLPHSIRPEYPAVGGSVPFAATVGSSFFWATLLLWLNAVARPAPAAGTRPSRWS